MQGELTDKELQKVLNAISELPESDKRDEITQIILKAASDSITLKKLKAMLPQSNNIENKQSKTGGYIKFTSKEIQSMPDYMKRIFIVNESAVPYRIVDGLYQARYRRNGFCIEVASKDFKTMKKKFMEKLIEKTTERENKSFPLFKDFIADWMKIKKQTVKPSTYESYSNLIEFNLISRFGDRHLNEITRKDIQDFLFELTDSGKMRTAAKLKQMHRVLEFERHKVFGVKNRQKLCCFPLTCALHACGQTPCFSSILRTKNCFAPEAMIF